MNLAEATRSQSMWGPWWEDPALIADLIEWIDFRRPLCLEDVTDLLRHPQTYQHDFEQMVAYGGAKLAGGELQ